MGLAIGGFSVLAGVFPPTLGIVTQSQCTAGTYCFVVTAHNGVCYESVASDDLARTCADRPRRLRESFQAD